MLLIQLFIHMITHSQLQVLFLFFSFSFLIPAPLERVSYDLGYYYYSTSRGNLFISLPVLSKLSNFMASTPIGSY
jgi:hypothetical protein